MDPEFDWIVNSLKELINSTSEALASGVADDYPKYAGLVGKISGYRDSIDLVENLRDMINKQEKE